MIITLWEDQWISENYPNAIYYIDEKSGEILVGLGVNEDGESTV
jgi:hypothetical protein